MATAATVVEVDDIVTRFGEQVVHDGVSFDVFKGTLVALIGGSGTGKSVLLREIIGLQRPTSGRIRLLGTDVWNSSEEEMNETRRRFGMMFQDGALFSSLTVAENVAVPLTEHARVPNGMLKALVHLRLAQAGLDPDAAPKMPRRTRAGLDVQRCNRAFDARNISLKALRSNVAGMSDSRSRLLLGPVRRVSRSTIESPRTMVRYVPGSTSTWKNPLLSLVTAERLPI